MLLFGNALIAATLKLCHDAVERSLLELEIGEKIKDIRKQNKLSQEQFAELFHVTRQTVSNWENGKSYPDLDTVAKISAEFDVQADDLLRKSTDIHHEENKVFSKKYRVHRLIILGLVVILVSGALIFYYKQANEFTFEMNQDKSIDTKDLNGQVLDIDSGYFTLPEDNNLSLNIAGNIDSGSLKVTIFDDDTDKEVYQLKGEELSDSQQIFLSKSSYKIQVEATGYQEEIVSVDYQVKLDG